MTTSDKQSKETDENVIQVGFMREDATFFEKVTYAYAQPLVEHNQNNKLKFEQYGELPDRLKIYHEADYL